MGKFSHKSTDWLATEIRAFTDQPDPSIPEPPMKFSMWKVLPRLVYFLTLILEFLVRIDQMKRR